MKCFAFLSYLNISCNNIITRRTSFARDKGSPVSPLRQTACSSASTRRRERHEKPFESCVVWNSNSLPTDSNFQPLRRAASELRPAAQFTQTLSVRAVATWLGCGSCLINFYRNLSTANRFKCLENATTLGFLNRV